MNLKDTLILVGSKLKIRKTRTAITIAAASLLFGVAITIFFVAKGYSNGLTALAKATFGEEVLLTVSYRGTFNDSFAVQERAVELYEQSTDEDKEYPLITPEPIGDYVFDPYLDPKNEFAVQAATEIKATMKESTSSAVYDRTVPYNGKVLSTLNYYTLKTESLTIENLTQAEGSSMSHAYPNYGGNPGVSVAAPENTEYLKPIIKISDTKDDVIQIIMYLSDAAKILDIPRPSARNADPSALKDYITRTNTEAIGHQFEATISTDDKEDKITYEIVGLLPPFGVSTINSSSMNPLSEITKTMSTSNYTQYSFIVTNSKSSAFTKYYQTDTSYLGGEIMVSMPNLHVAETFQKNNDNHYVANGNQLSISEFISNRLMIHSMEKSINTTVVIFSLLLSIVAVIIMVGTVGRVIDDERQTIALYRTVGASTSNILQVFSGYILSLCGLIIICSTLIALIISGVITITNTTLITANAAALYNIAEASPIIFIGFDPRILLIYLLILIVGSICLLLVFDRLTSKNIIKDLRK